MNARQARSGLLRVGLVSALAASCAGNQEQRIAPSAELAESASLLGIGDVSFPETQLRDRRHRCRLCVVLEVRHRNRNRIARVIGLGGG